MDFFSSHKKEKKEDLPTIVEPKHSYETAKSADTITKDTPQNNTATSTSPRKPLPSRNSSTRFQEPTRTPSQQMKSTSSAANTTSTKNDKKKPQRPGLQRRRTTARTRLIEMHLDLDNVPTWHKIMASLSTWVLLAGYIVFPATFNKLQKDKDLDEKANSELKAHALATARNVPLLYIASFSCGIGVLGCLFLWFKHRKNYIWVIQNIFLPSLMNSVAGLVSTLVNIYSAQDGQYSVTAKVTIIVTAVCSVITVALFLVYNYGMLWWVKREHEKETRDVERSLSFQQDLEEEKRARREGTERVS